MKYPLILFLFFISSSIFAQKENKFTINNCVDYAMKNNLQVKNALLNIGIQQETNTEVTAAALPTISSSISATKFIDLPVSLIPNEFFGGPKGTFTPVRFGTKYNSTAEIHLEQLLFDGQVFIAIQARRTTMDWVKKSTELTQEQIKTNILKISYQLIASKTQIALIETNLQRLYELLRESTILYKNGFIENIELDKITVQLNNLKTEKAKLVNAIDFGYLGLKTLMGMPSKEKLLLTDTLTENDIDNIELLEKGFDYNLRKDFQYLNIAKKLNEFNVKRYELSKIPTLSLSASFAKNAQRNEFDFLEKKDWFTNTSVSMKLAIPIFSGFARDARISRTKLELQQVVNQIEQTKITIDNEITQYKLNYQQSLESLHNQKANMQLAENVYNQTNKKLQQGVGSNLEVTNAQADLIAAQNNYMNSLYSFLVAKVDLLKSLGKL